MARAMVAKTKISIVAETRLCEQHVVCGLLPGHVLIYAGHMCYIFMYHHSWKHCLRYS
jgi:hypothetical protein